MEHVEIPLGDVHTPINWLVPSAFARESLPVLAGDVGKLSMQSNDHSIWMLVSSSPPAWVHVNLPNVTNDAQTHAAVVPNTAPAPGQVLVGTGSAYLPQTLAGDAALSPAGVLTIAPGAVSNDKLSPMVSGTIKGRFDSGTGAPQNLTPSQVRDILDVNTVDGGNF